MAETKLGVDGEPEPIGNEAQRLAGAAVAATFNKKVAKTDHKKDVPVDKPQDNTIGLNADQLAVILGQTQPVTEPNSVGSKNFQAQAQGTVTKD